MLLKEEQPKLVLLYALTLQVTPPDRCWSFSFRPQTLEATCHLPGLSSLAPHATPFSSWFILTHSDGHTTGRCIWADGQPGQRFQYYNYILFIRIHKLVFPFMARKIPGRVCCIHLAPPRTLLRQSLGGESSLQLSMQHLAAQQQWAFWLLLLSVHLYDPDGHVPQNSLGP